MKHEDLVKNWNHVWDHHGGCSRRIDFKLHRNTDYFKLVLKMYDSLGESFVKEPFNYNVTAYKSSLDGKLSYKTKIIINSYLLVMGPKSIFKILLKNFIWEPLFTVTMNHYLSWWELLVHILGLNQGHSWTLLINVLIEPLIQDPPLISVKYFHRTTVLLVVKSFPTDHPDFAVSRNHCRLNMQVCPFTNSKLELVCILFVQSSKAEQ